MNDQLDTKDWKEEQAEFPFVKLMQHKPELWKHLCDFYGIDETKFPYDQLAFQQDTNKNIMLLNAGLNELLTYKKKTKYNVVNIGLKLF